MQVFRSSSNKLLNQIKCLRNIPKKATFTTEPTKGPKKIFSGIQPTGSIHIGNYFGAVKQWVDLQNKGDDVIYCIVDLHATTMPQDPQKLKNNSLVLAATLLACGIDPNKAILFLQSSVHQHTELCWTLACITTMPRLSHLPQYKEKSKKMKEIPLGLFIYPVLQAADILLYKATHVPVGDDQLQQIQLAQHLAQSFNFKFGNTFPPCHSMTVETACRIRSLRDPTKKMSKSDPDGKSSIFLADKPEEILEKVKKAVTDFTSEVTYDPEKRLGVSNLISIHSLASGLTPEQICMDAKGLDTGKYKLRVADALIAHLNPIRLKIEDYLKHPEYIEDILKKGAENATEIASQTLSEVRSKVGFLDLNNRQKEEFISKKAC